MAARPLATPQFTSAVVVDSRTVTLSWTPVKGAHHYVVEYAPAMRVYTTETSVTITDLYPGDGHYFTVRAETRRNVPSRTSDPIIVPTPTGPTRAPCNRSPSRTPQCGTWPKRPARR
jgi:Fibronectin type III domain